MIVNKEPFNLIDPHHCHRHRRMIRYHRTVPIDSSERLFKLHCSSGSTCIIESIILQYCQAKNATIVGVEYKNDNKNNMNIYFKYITLISSTNQILLSSLYCKVIDNKSGNT